MPEAKPPPDPRLELPLFEEELDELPPIDGDEVDEEDSSPEELDEQPDDGDGDPLDDSTGEEDPLEEIEVGGSESGWLDDAGDSDALDVGTPDTFGKEEDSSSLLEGAEEPDVGEEEMSFGAEEGSLVGDAGEEGFEDEEEDLREEDLPRLDSGQDDAEIEDPDLLDALPDDDVSEEPRPPWDDRAWERVEGGPPGLAAVDALACGSEGLVVGGQGLARIDRAGRLTALEAAGLRGGAPQALVADGAWICASTPRAGVLVSTDGGKSFVEANGWRALVAADDSEEGLQLVFAGGDLWGRTRAGALVWSGDRGATWGAAVADMRFDAIAGDASSGELVAIAREATASAIARGKGGKLAASTAPVLPAGKLLSFVAQAGHMAVALARGAFRAEDGEWARLEGTAALTALSFARGDGTLVVALHSEGEGRAWVLEARVGAPAFTVAELGDTLGASHEDGDDSRVRALCWDETAGVVWAAGGFGLVALRPARH